MARACRCSLIVDARSCFLAAVIRVVMSVSSRLDSSFDSGGFSAGFSSRQLSSSAVAMVSSDATLPTLGSAATGSSMVSSIAFSIGAMTAFVLAGSVEELGAR